MQTVKRQPHTGVANPLSSMVSAGVSSTSFGGSKQPMIQRLTSSTWVALLAVGLSTPVRAEQPETSQAEPASAPAAPVKTEQAQAQGEVPSVDAQAAPAVPVMSANGGAESGAGELERHSGLEATEQPTVAQLQPAEVKPAEVKTAAEPAQPSVPDDGVVGKIGAGLRLSYLAPTAYQVDADGMRLRPSPFETRLRINPEVRYWRFGFIAEVDTASGALLGLPAESVVAERTPHKNISALDVRQIYAEYKWATGALRIGQQTSNWGLGLLANSGAKDAEAGDFGQSYFGTLAYRAAIAGRPFFSLGGAFRAIEPILAVDLIARDATADFELGDRAFQGIFAARFNIDADHNIGIYTVVRRQTRQGVTDGGGQTNVFIFDVAGKWQFLKTDERALNVGFELATINGTTTQARNEASALLTVRQLGAALKSSFRYRRTQVYFDMGYASGDQNPFDDRIENFRFDRDFNAGLVLFEEVLGYQTARGAARAADPMLVGQAPEGAELMPTGGAVTGAVYLNPRVRYGVREWLDVYGGPLFAFSTAALTDPFNTRVYGGGVSLNALGGRPGSYLGTELDVGAQLRWKPWKELQLSATGEFGLLLPGDAFTLRGGSGVMAPVALGRVRLSASL